MSTPPEQAVLEHIKQNHPDVKCIKFYIGDGTVQKSTEYEERIHEQGDSSVVFAGNEPNYQHCEQNYITNDYSQSEQQGIHMFFQALQALEWFKDSRGTSTTADIELKLNSSSRLISGYRSYRLYVSSRLCEMNATQDSQVSCSESDAYSGLNIKDILNDTHCFLTQPQREHVRTYLNAPLRYDYNHSDSIPNTSYEINPEWSKAFLHIVNETVFYHRFNHLTEKIFKPIILGRPFIVVSTPGSLQYLRRYGFKTFSPWLNEAYDQIHNHADRLEMITDEIQRIHSQPLSVLQMILNEMLPIVEHNRRLFWSESFRSKIFQELSTNLNTIC